MNKKDLRLDFKERRKKISTQFLTNASLSIANNSLKVPIWDFDYYHLFLSITKNKEPDTSYLLSILRAKDKKVVVPKVNNKTLLGYLLTENTGLRKNKWGIPEPTGGHEVSPEKIDVVFVPLLAFDGQGNRVGYGKGFYDHFLSNCRPNVIKVGLSFFNPVKIIDDLSKNDIPLDYCITPKKIYSFGTDPSSVAE